MSGHSNTTTSGLRLPSAAPSARARSRSPAPPRSTSSATAAGTRTHGDAPKARPAWNDNIHDLDQLKLTPDQARKKKQLQVAYAPSRVSAVSPSRGPSRRPSVSPSTAPAPGGGPTTSTSNSWPVSAPRPNPSARRPSATPSLAPARRGSSSNAPAPGPAHLDPDLAPRGRAPRRHVMRDAAELTHVSGRMSAGAFRRLRTALVVARQVAQGEGIEMQFEDGDDDGYPVGGDDEVDRVAESAAGTVVELAKRVQMLDQRLATECDMRRRLDGQVQVLSEQLRKLSDQVAVLDARPTSRSSRGDDAGGSQTMLKRIAHLEAAVRDKQTADHIAALDDLFSSMEL